MKERHVYFNSLCNTMAVVGIGFLLPFSVFPHDILKTDAARITKLDMEMFHDEYWKPIYFWVKY